MATLYRRFALGSAQGGAFRGTKKERMSLLALRLDFRLLANARLEIRDRVALLDGYTDLLPAPFHSHIHASSSLQAMERGINEAKID
jgi:hypothetical protein